MSARSQDPLPPLSDGGVPDWISNWFEGVSARATAGSLAAAGSQSLEGVSARATAGSIEAARGSSLEGYARASAGSIGTLTEPILPLEQPINGSAVRIWLEDISRKFACAIAETPQTLDHLEWRDVERTMAEVFDGLGFNVTLTQPTKDGGKDIVLQCLISGMNTKYFVEIKHWRSRKKVGIGFLQDFLLVIIQEQTAGGLFLSTSGYSKNAAEQLTEIDRRRLYLGGETKVVNLCQTYVKVRAGAWSPPREMCSILSNDEL